mgnify:CR=1 FL=1
MTATPPAPLLSPSETRPQTAVSSKAGAATILIVDDVAANIGVLSGALESAGYRVLAALSGTAALKSAAKAPPDLILLDVLMPELDGIETCQRLKRDPRTAGAPVIFITANDETQSLVQGFGAGGVDYITKPFQIDEVLARVGTQLRIHRLTRDLAARTEELERTNSQLRSEIKRREMTEEALRAADEKLTLLTEAEARQWGLAGFVGRSAPFGRMLKEIRSVQNFPRTNVLLTGESGTGKELIARAVHFGGSQPAGPFIAVNCSALPVELAESHLFGHVRGAFTGAVSDRKGYFELANGGTLFLDELGDMPLALQAKLLRVLEDGQVTAIGGTASRRVSVRVVAATNVDLPAKVAAGAFRQDLYYRLMHFHVEVPPLRERREDIPALAQHFLKLLATELKRKPPQLTTEALDRLLSHSYPGNVRELKNTIERAIIYAGGDHVLAEHIVFAPQAGCGANAPSPGMAVWPEAAVGSLKLRDNEDQAIRRAIQASGGNLCAAARLLGVNRSRLYRWQARQEGEDAQGRGSLKSAEVVMD